MQRSNIFNIPRPKSYVQNSRNGRAKGNLKHHGLLSAAFFYALRFRGSLHNESIQID